MKFKWVTFKSLRDFNYCMVVLRCIGLNRSCICIQCNTRTRTEPTCPDWVFTALKTGGGGSKQQLPQKQKFKSKIASIVSENQMRTGGWKCTENVFVHDWKETLLWLKKSTQLWFCKWSCTQMMVTRYVSSSLHTKNNCLKPFLWQNNIQDFNGGFIVMLSFSTNTAKAKLEVYKRDICYLRSTGTVLWLSAEANSC